MIRFVMAAGALVLSLVMAQTIPANAQTVSDPNITVSPYTTGLSLPTGFQFVGDGSMDLFVIEKNTGLVKYASGGTTTTVLDLAVANNSERGLLGIELDPAFTTNNYVYLYYSANQNTGTSSVDGGTWVDNRLVRYTFDSGTNTLGSPTTLFNFPPNPVVDDGPNHDGGPLRFGPDGLLYGATGDLNRDLAEQNNKSAPATSAHVGGIYRFRPDPSNLIPDGSLPGETANPLVDPANAADLHKWYAYGLRNSFGLGFDPATGNLWDTENGPSSFDEINLVAPGFNSGWNSIMGPDSRDPQNAPDDLVVLVNSAYSDPEFSFETPVAITAIAFLAGSNLGPAYDDAVLVGAARGDAQHVYLFRLNEERDGFVFSDPDLEDLVLDDTDSNESILFSDSLGAITDIQVGPDGNVYILSLSGGALYQVVPEPSTWALAAVSLLAGVAFAFRRRAAAATNRHCRG